MNTDILSIDAIVMEEVWEESATPLINETGADPETVSPVDRRFGIADLWKIQNTKRHFGLCR